jgi:hypothetical protein
VMMLSRLCRLGESVSGRTQKSYTEDQDPCLNERSHAL